MAGFAHFPKCSNGGNPDHGAVGCYPPVAGQPLLSAAAGGHDLLRVMQLSAHYSLIKAVLIFVVGMVFAISTPAQDSPHLNVIQPGGMPGLPLMTGANKVTNGVNVTWYGPPGYYQLYAKTNLKTGNWVAVGGMNLSNNATITTVTGNAFFRVAGPSPHYVGYAACQECHQDTHDEVALTPHVGAFSSATFIAAGGQTNTSCLPCHTVGAGLPTGFTSLAKTPQLAGVQCESCHGPAGLHAADPTDVTSIPHVELASQVCGGCHNTQFAPASAAQYHAPHFEEWNSSPHQSVLPDVQSLFTGSRATNYISSCGRCHSGTVREALVDNLPLPDGHEASAVGIACGTCHEPHGLVVHTNALNGRFTNSLSQVFTNSLLGAVYTNQLRDAIASLKDFSLSTSDVFSNKYDPDINACAQCHNHRGADWTDSSRPPHHSPQYNMLLGTVGLQTNGLPPNQPGTHAFIEKQCSACHMQASNYVSAAFPATAGHQFEVTTFDVCAQCHGSAANGQNLASFISTVVGMQIQAVAASLDTWAATKAPTALQTKYGAGAWEYSAPGELSTLTAGPTAAEQALIPDNIKKARFNLYLVQNDGSGGVHNPFYCLDLLLAANQFVQQELTGP